MGIWLKTKNINSIYFRRIQDDSHIMNLEVKINTVEVFIDACGQASKIQHPSIHRWIKNPAFWTIRRWSVARRNGQPGGKKNHQLDVPPYPKLFFFGAHCFFSVHQKWWDVNKRDLTSEWWNYRCLRMGIQQKYAKKVDWIGEAWCWSQRGSILANLHVNFLEDTLW